MTPRRDTEEDSTDGVRESTREVTNLIQLCTARQLLPMTETHTINLQQQSAARRETPFMLWTKGCDVSLPHSSFDYSRSCFSLILNPINHDRMWATITMLLGDRRTRDTGAAPQRKYVIPEIRKIQFRRIPLKATSVWIEGNHFPTTTPLNFISITYVRWCQAFVNDSAYAVY